MNSQHTISYLCQLISISTFGVRSLLQFFFKGFLPSALIILVFTGLQLLTALTVLFVPFPCASSLMLHRNTISATFLF